jgi:hypothetical protein
MKWLPTCRETTALASRAMDAQFNLQLHEMRRLFRAEAGADDDAAALTADARQRIATELQKELDP